MILQFFLTRRDWSEDRVRNTIKKLLEHYSQTHLERMQCPFSQVGEQNKLLPLSIMTSHFVYVGDIDQSPKRLNR